MEISGGKLLFQPFYKAIILTKLTKQTTLSKNPIKPPNLIREPNLQSNFGYHQTTN